MRRTQIYLDETVWERIERLTARDSRSMSEIVRAALERFLAEQERGQRPLAEVAVDWVGAWRDEGDPAAAHGALREELAERARRLGY